MAKLFYSIQLAGFAGTGVGVIVFDQDGLVVGADAGGVTYVGDFTVEKGCLASRVLVTVPAGAGVVTGAPPSGVPRQFHVTLSIPLDDVMNEIRVDTPIGPVRFQLKKIYTSP